jgi:hypothetical protein
LKLIFLLPVWLFRPAKTLASFKKSPIFLYYLVSAAISILSAVVNHSLHLPAISAWSSAPANVFVAFFSPRKIPGLRLFPSKSSPIHHSSVILPVDAM